jgi:hypothetical protein
MPLFTHDSACCTFLGNDEEHDFYFCNKQVGGETVIARYGNDGPDYISGIHSAVSASNRGDNNNPLCKALVLARERGLTNR